MNQRTQFDDILRELSEDVSPRQFAVAELFVGSSEALVSVPGYLEIRGTSVVTDDPYRHGMKLLIGGIEIQVVRCDFREAEQITAGDGRWTY